MHSEDDIITTEVEVITYVEETDGFYKNIKVEAASPDSVTESSLHNVSIAIFVIKMRIRGGLI